MRITSVHLPPTAGETGTRPAHLFCVYFVADCHNVSVCLKITLVTFAANVLLEEAAFLRVIF